MFPPFNPEGNTLSRFQIYPTTLSLLSGLAVFLGMIINYSERGVG